MAILNQNDLVEAMAGGRQGRPFRKDSITTVAGIMYSLWKATGRPQAGATPTTAAVCDLANAGGILHTDAGGGNTLYLGRASFSSTVAGTLVLYDRLIHMGGLDGTSVGTQTVSTPALPSGRCDPNGLDVQCFLEWYTATGASARTATINYTDQGGASGTTTASLHASVAASALIEVVPASGDSGFRDIDDLTLSASTGTAGNFGVTLARKLIEIPIGLANVGGDRSGFEMNLPIIPADACLWLVWMPSTTSSGIVTGQLDLIEG